MEWKQKLAFINNLKRPCTFIVLNAVDGTLLNCKPVKIRRIGNSIRTQNFAAGISSDPRCDRFGTNASFSKSQGRYDDDNVDDNDPTKKETRFSAIRNRKVASLLLFKDSKAALERDEYFTGDGREQDAELLNCTRDSLKVWRTLPLTTYSTLRGRYVAEFALQSCLVKLQVRFQHSEWFAKSHDERQDRGKKSASVGLQLFLRVRSPMITVFCSRNSSVWFQLANRK